MEFRNKTVIVTGAGSGIGQAIAELFAAHGANVVIAEINRRDGKETEQQIRARGGQAFFVETDISEEESVKRMVDTTVASFGSVNALCNNAAIDVAKDFCELQPREWDEILSVNLRSVFLCTQQVVGHLIHAGGGSVVNISSVQALATTGHVSAYAASKGGILSLTRDLARDFGPFNIRVNAVCPGCIDTPMQDRALARLPNPAGALDRLNRSIPLKRTGKPEELAEAVLFLASQRASYITGVTLVVDGGLLTQLPLQQ